MTAPDWTPERIEKAKESCALGGLVPARWAGDLLDALTARDTEIERLRMALRGLTMAHPEPVQDGDAQGVRLLLHGRRNERAHQDGARWDG